MPWRNVKTHKNRESGGRRARGTLLLFIGQLGKVLMKKRLRKIKIRQKSWARAFLASEAACAKVLRQHYAWYVGGTALKLMKQAK